MLFYSAEMNLCKMRLINKWEDSLNTLKIKSKGKSTMISKEFSKVHMGSILLVLFFAGNNLDLTNLQRVVLVLPPNRYSPLKLYFLAIGKYKFLHHYQVWIENTCFDLVRCSYSNINFSQCLILWILSNSWLSLAYYKT